MKKVNSVRSLISKKSVKSVASTSEKKSKLITNKLFAGKRYETQKVIKRKALQEVVLSKTNLVAQTPRPSIPNVFRELNTKSKTMVKAKSTDRLEKSKP